MKWIEALRQHLGWKLFLSYLAVVAVGAAVLVATAQLQAPNALARHVARMQALAGDNPALTDNLYENFATAVSEIMLFAILAAVCAAAVASLFVARRIVSPVAAMTQVSQSIADGDYHQRIQVASPDELGMLAQAFNRMAETLEQSEQRRMELIGDVAHELRTPLTNIRNITEGLIDDVYPPDSETFVRIQQEVGRLQRLVHDLEDLSRAEASQIPLDLRPLALNDAIRRAAERLAAQFEDKGITLEVDLAPGLPVVQADADRFMQVLTNLLGNALQYTPTGGRVTVTARVKNRMLMVAVQDTGIGISTGDLPHIFERFYRADKSRSRAGGGSGIGLTISKHLVEAHGGRIWADSPGPGKGTTISFILPFSF